MENQMRTVDQLASQLFLTDLPATPFYQEIQIELQQKYSADSDDEYPDAYWSELSDLLQAVLSKAGDMALSVEAAA